MARASDAQEEGRHYRVPKRDLVAALEVPFHNGTLKVAGSLELWPTLGEELLNFRRKIGLRTAHDPYEHARRVALMPTPRARKAKDAPTFSGSPFTARDFGL